MAEIRLENVRKEFKDIVAVRDVSITFPTSTVTCLLGPSGCGKTTLMRMIAGLDTLTTGEIYFDNERVTDLSPQDRNIGMVFQYPVVYRGISVYRNIELGLMHDRLPVAERKQRIEKVVEILGLQKNLNQDITQLDNGTRQKVAVARAVVRQPRIILFDEPITNVDVDARVQLKRALKNLTRQHQQTIIYVTHDQTEAMTLADEIALMQDGEIVQRDAPRELYDHPNNVFGGWFLGNPGMNFIEYDVDHKNGVSYLAGPLFLNPVSITETNGHNHISIGIRPEKVSVTHEQTAMAVRGQIVNRSIVVGGQYLLTLMIGEQRLKAKVPAQFGLQNENDVWIECPLEHITLFGTDGRRLDARLSAPPE